MKKKLIDLFPKEEEIERYIGLQTYGRAFIISKAMLDNDDLQEKAISPVDAFLICFDPDREEA